MASAGERAQRLVAAAYRAAVEPGLWGEFADELLAVCDGPAAVALRVFDLRRLEETVIATAGIDEAHLRSYVEYYAGRNIYRGPLLDLPVRLVVATRQVLERDVLVRSEVYNDWLRPQGLGPFGIAYHAARDRSSLLTLSVNQSAAHEERQWPEMARLMALVGPHLSHAAQFNSRRTAAAERRAMADTVQSLALATIVVDSAGRVSNANARAERLLRAGPLFVNRAGRLRARSPGADQQVQRALDAALAVPGRSTTSRIADFGAEGHIYLTAVPLPPVPHRLRGWALLGGADAPCAAVHLARERRGAAEVVPQLVAVYGLDAIDAQLAYGVYSGARLARVAEGVGIPRWQAVERLEHVKEILRAPRHADIVRRVWAVVHLA